MPFERFERPRDSRVPGPPVLRVGPRRSTITLSKRALAMLGDHVTHVYLAADEDDQALAILPAVVTPKSQAKDSVYVLNRRTRTVSAQAFLRAYAIAPGKYRAEKQRVLGLDSVAAHYVRSDRG